MTEEPRLSETVLIETTVQSMFFDFLTGDLSPLEPLYPFLKEHGFTSSDFSYFSQRGTGIDVMGVNFYPQFSFQHIGLDGKGREVRKNHQLWTEDLVRTLRSRYERYRCPMMVTETSVRDDLAMKEKWLGEASQAVLAEFEAGLPVVGFTWFPVIDMYDWEYRVEEGNKDQFKARFGFWDHDRNEYCGAPQYRKIIAGAKESRR